MTARYPAFLQLAGLRVVAIGGGRVAERKVEWLCRSGASVLIVSPAVRPALAALIEDGKVSWKRRPYQPGDLEGARLAFVATDSREVNAAAAEEAGALGVPVNVADDPEASTFEVPALIKRGGIAIAVSTGGRSPAFARRLREELESWLTPDRLALFELYAELRSDLRENERAVNGEAWAAVDGQALDLLRQGRRAEARQVLEDQVSAAARRAG